MQELTLNEFMKFCESKKTGLIYVKRDDCPKCIELDRYIDGIMDDSVPTFLKIVKGNVVESFSFEDKDLIANLIKNDM